MRRRPLLLLEPLRRRPYGERSYSPVRARRRERARVTTPLYASVVSRRGAARSR